MLASAQHFSGRRALAKANYGFEKRQRELAKKKKQEEKRLRKAAEKAETPVEGQPEPAPADAEPKTGN
jgi:hypothetical protein